MAVKVREKVTADGKKFQKMLEDLDKLEVRIGIQQGAVAIMVWIWLISQCSMNLELSIFRRDHSCEIVLTLILLKSMPFCSQ